MRRQVSTITNLPQRALRLTDTLRVALAACELHTVVPFWKWHLLPNKLGIMLPMDIPQLRMSARTWEALGLEPHLRTEVWVLLHHGTVPEFLDKAVPTLDGRVGDLRHLFRSSVVEPTLPCYTLEELSRSVHGDGSIHRDAARKLTGMMSSALTKLTKA